MMVSAEAVA